MIAAKRFRLGGLQPHIQAHRVPEEAIWNATLPSALLVPMKVRGQRASVCLVTPGEELGEGMVIGAADSKGVPVHSPVPGRVREIRDINLPGNGECEAVLIDLEGEFERLGKHETPQPWEHLEAEEVIQLLHGAGVVELNRPDTGFVEGLNRVRRSKARRIHILVAAFDNEPLSRTEATVLTRFSNEVATGIGMLLRAIPKATVSLGHTWSSRRGARTVARHLQDLGIRTRTALLQNLYPQADDTQLIDTLLGKELGDIHSAQDHGILCVSPSTLFAVCMAVKYRRPLIERFVTVAGNAVQVPRVLRARIGTNIAELIRECGGFRTEPAKIVLGGSFRGSAVYRLDTPLNKDTSSILVLDTQQIHDAEIHECMQCGLCSQHCPSGLEPMRLYKFIERGYLKHAEAEGIEACTSCGICSSVCPARIPLSQGIHLGLDRLHD